MMRRGTKWYLRVKVPDDVVDAIGKREIWKSLRTGDYQLARRRASSSVSVRVPSLAALNRRSTAVLSSR